VSILLGTIEDHRALFRADLLIPKLVSRQPPTSLDANTGVLHQEPGSAVGMSMSGRLLRYLSHPEGYGSDGLNSASLALALRALIQSGGLAGEPQCTSG